MSLAKESVLQGENNQGGGWEKLWQMSKTPWDAGAIQPALTELFANHRDILPTSGRALVPGCGRGYDVPFLAQQGFQALGIDSSSTAISTAQSHNKDAPVSPGSASFAVTDFFKFDVEGEGYDFGFDYTFLCALPPTLRPQWAKRWTELVKSGGILAPLVFPIDGPRDDGPPYAVTLELYDELLGEGFERLLEFKPTEGGRKEKQRMAVYRRH